MLLPPFQESKDTCRYGGDCLVLSLEQVSSEALGGRFSKSNNIKGPAHAVYFATYEMVKQAMGGNAHGHHPLAAGMMMTRASAREYG